MSANIDDYPLVEFVENYPKAPKSAQDQDQEPVREDDEEQAGDNDEEQALNDEEMTHYVEHALELEFRQTFFNLTKSETNLTSKYRSPYPHASVITQDSPTPRSTQNPLLPPEMDPLSSVLLLTNVSESELDSPSRATIKSVNEINDEVSKLETEETAWFSRYRQYLPVEMQVEFTTRVRCSFFKSSDLHH